MTNWDYIDTYLDLTYGKRDLVIIDRDAEGNCIGPDERAKKQHYDQMNEMWNRYIQIWRKAIKRELYRLKYQEVTE